MKDDRNINVIRHMLEYCDRIDDTVKFFGNEYEIFKDNHIYKDSISLCILQIGELTGVLTDGFKETYNKMPWKQIKALRNIVAHRYGTVDPELLWEIVNVDIPELKNYCQDILLLDTNSEQ